MNTLPRIALIYAANKLNRKDIVILLLNNEQSEQLSYQELISILPSRDLFTAVDLWQAATKIRLN